MSGKKLVDELATLESITIDEEHSYYFNSLPLDLRYMARIKGNSIEADIIADKETAKFLLENKTIHIVITGESSERIKNCRDVPSIYKNE